MSTTDKHRSRLITLLKELFQLDQPELDFGLYKIMHAKSVQITHFLETDLLKEIEQAFGEKDSIDASQLKAQAITKLKEALGDDAIDEQGNLEQAFRNIPAGKKYLEEMAAAEAAKGTLNAESEIYDHLYRFFERYYDSGDFMSRRYYARESDSRAAPYAVPYDGREVYLHWANKDQYYIKSSEYLTNYTFDLHEAIRQEGERQASQKGKGQGLDTSITNDDQPLKVHFRIVEANEGEHGNIKAASDQKRFFIIHAEKPVEWLSMDEGKTNQLIINFQYRSDNEKTGQDNKWQETRLQQAEAVILEALKADTSAAAFLQGLTVPSPTDSKNKRTLLGKYLQKYAARNTMDYFIHKDLGGFLRRELDFYIKNEIMRLDDIENAEVPKVEQYLAKIRVLRRIAQQLIAFLAQLEDFQKNLWLKKKFVTETHYCITLDRIPESFYAEIATNNLQHEEWVKLFAIDEIQADLVNPAYSTPLTTEFLKANPYLLVDTALFDEGFKQKLLDAIHDLDAQCDGILIHSENFQALGLMQQKYREQVKCIYIDPPYNTENDGFAYKDSYKSSSWLSMIQHSSLLAEKLTRPDDAFFAMSIDKRQLFDGKLILENSFTRFSFVNAIVNVNNPKGRSDQKHLPTAHDNIVLFSTDGAVSHGWKPENKVLRRYRKQDEDGSFREIDLRKTGDNDLATDRPNMAYPFAYNQVTGDLYPTFSDNCPDGYFFIYPMKDEKTKGRWRWEMKTSEKNISRLLAKYQPQKQQWTIFEKDYLGEDERVFPTSIWDEKPFNSERGTESFINLGFDKDAFVRPKPVGLLLYLFEHLNRDGKFALDYFAGSGTTGHALINLNRDDGVNRNYILIEQGDHFDTVLKARIQKVVYSKEWKDGKPISREGISHCFKTLRLESYEDTLNNLVLKTDSSRDAALVNNPSLQRDYLLNYFLDVETESSQSLLNIADFRDPTAYQMRIKKPGSGEQALQNIDLIETFNWLIGLWVEQMAVPQVFSAEFERETDPDLPKDQNTRLICKRLKADANGAYWFRLIEGYTLKIPGDNTSKVPTLIVWRKQTDDPEKDNAVLQKYLLEKLQISPREQTYGVIYINGSHTLPNPVVEGEQTKVRLIEEAFHNAMWSGEVG